MILQAGFPPIKTFVAQAPRRDDPCIVVSPSLAAGLPNGFSLSVFWQFNYSVDTEQQVSDNSNGIAGIDELQTIHPGEWVTRPRHRTLDDNRPATVIAYTHSVLLI